MQRCSLEDRPAAQSVFDPFLPRNQSLKWPPSFLKPFKPQACTWAFYKVIPFALHETPTYCSWKQDFICPLFLFFSAKKLLDKVCLTTKTEYEEKKHCYYTIICIRLWDNTSLFTRDIYIHIWIYGLNEDCITIVYDHMLAQVHSTLQETRRNVFKVKNDWCSPCCSYVNIFKG